MVIVMAIRATIIIDGRRWAKHPYGVEFEDNECNSRFYMNGVNSRESCYKAISLSQ